MVIRIKLKKFICIFVVVLLSLNLVCTHNAYAGLDKLMQYVTPEGGMSNVNNSAIMKDQAGGYMTGGSILLRGPKPKELTPVQIQTPKLKFDACTGSGDFRFGALSYISGREFSEFLKGVARSSGAYLLKMSIKTACPQCEDIMTYLETVSRDINGLSINQCAMAQSIASGAFSKIASSERQHCMMAANVSGSNKDMFDTTRKCQDSAGENTRNSEGEFESMLGDQFNLVWKALSKGTTGSTDSNLKELMMSISGTIIGKKEDGRFKFESKPSLLRDKRMLEKYIGSSKDISKIKLYQCVKNDENDKCLKVAEVESELKESDSLYGNISKIIRNLVIKIINDSGEINLADEEATLIGFSTIPILPLIKQELASKPDPEQVIIRISDYIEVICYDVITNFMEDMLSNVISKVQSLEHAQTDNTVIRNFIEDAGNIRKFLSDSKFGAFQKLQVIMEVKRRLAYLP